MKKFKVIASYITYCVVDIEAEDQDEAYQIALNMDGGDFETQMDGDDWHIESVEAIDD